MGSLKKILTIVLCAAMIMAGSVYVNASDSVSDSDSSDNLTDNELQAAKVENEVKDDMGTQILGNDMKEKIGDEVEVLDDLGYTDDSIDDVTVKDGDIVYQQTFETGNETIASDFTVDCKDNGNVVFDITEGNKNDTVLLSDAGNVYINGKKVIYETEVTDESNEITGCGGYTRFASCPSSCGNASQYTYYVKTIKDNINLNQWLSTISISALAIAIQCIPGIGQAAGIASGVALALEGSAVSYVHTKYVSAKRYIYYRSDKKSFMIDSARGCRKEKTKYYSGKNYNDYACTKTTFLMMLENGC